MSTDRPAFLDGFATEAFIASGLLGKALHVNEAQRQYAVSLALRASPGARATASPRSDARTSGTTSPR